MAKVLLTFVATFIVSAAAFAPATMSGRKTDTLAAAVTGFEEVGGEPWDPLSLAKLEEASGDVFPNMFPLSQYMEESERKHCRMAMLGWTGIWATHQGGFGLGLHIPGMPEEPDWTKALGVFAEERPIMFGVICLLIGIAEGESVGHSGDNWRNKGSKEPGNLNFDPFGLKSKLSEERQERYKWAEIKNGRAAMIGMASMFAFESIPGSVPIMDLLGAQ